MDTAIKAEWYDLDDADREGFLAWLHGHHLPALQARPGHIWIGHYNRAPKSDAGVNERWTGRHVLKIVVHAPHGPHAGRRIWPPV
ncbi:MAG: hypothetical protein HY322_09725 [Betaproteobacteria bacterium]|nr:hypothetical protein [Betaproteobacteria bacterium]